MFYIKNHDETSGYDLITLNRGFELFFSRRNTQFDKNFFTTIINFINNLNEF